VRIKRQIRDFLQNTASTDPIAQEIQQRFLNGTLGATEAELARLKAAERTLELERAHIEGEVKVPEALRTPPSEETINGWVELDQDIAKMRYDLDRVTLAMKAYEKNSRPENRPQPYKDLEAQKVELEAKIAALLPKVREAVTKKIMSDYKKGLQYRFE